MNSTVCGIVKNEARGIAEWVAYQRVIGFDAVLIYDNGSTDATPAILDSISKHDPAVSRIEWPDRPGQVPQRTAYQDAITRSQAGWIAFFDVDEFLVLHRHPNVNTYLASMADEVSAIAINWRIFGSGGRRNATHGLVIDRFRRCSARENFKNLHCKTIVRRARISSVNVHTCVLKAGVYASSDGQPLDMTSDAQTPSVDHTGAQLNHYVLKSFEEYVEKRARGRSSRKPEAPDKYTARGDITEPPAEGQPVTSGNEYWILHDLNDTTDRSIRKIRQELISRLAEWGFERSLRVRMTHIWSWVSCSKRKNATAA